MKNTTKYKLHAGEWHSENCLLLTFKSAPCYCDLGKNRAEVMTNEHTIPCAIEILSNLVYPTIQCNGNYEEYHSQVIIEAIQKLEKLLNLYEYETPPRSLSPEEHTEAINRFLINGVRREDPSILGFWAKVLGFDSGYNRRKKAGQIIS